MKKTLPLIVITFIIGFANMTYANEKQDSKNNSQHKNFQKSLQESSHSLKKLEYQLKHSHFLNTNFSLFEKNVTNDSLKNSISNSVDIYKKLVKKIQDGGKKIRNQISDEFDANLKSGHKILKEQTALYNKHCNTSQDKKGLSECQAIHKNIFEIQQKINKVTIDKNNQLGNIYTQEINKLNQLKTTLLNNINKKREKAGLSKVNPFSF